MSIIARRDYVSAAVIRRLPRYYRFLSAQMERGITRTSSREIARLMGLTASQIRQDLNCFGGFGQQGYGYNVSVLHGEIAKILGLDRHVDAILVGAGNLGRALVNYMMTSGRSFRLVGIFDNDPEKVGSRFAGHTILPVSDFRRFCAEHRPGMAVLTVPQAAAKSVVDALVEAGVTSFWNFTHYDVAYHHPDCSVESVFLEDSLMTLSYLIQDRDAEPEA